MQGRSLIRFVILALCVGATTLGLRNTYGDNSESLASAQKAACGTEGCSYTLLRESRSAFGHQYSLQTQLVQKGKAAAGGTAEVECKREFYLIGEWRCALAGSGR